MDAKNPTFLEFRAYWQLSEEMIADATKEDLAEVAGILTMQAVSRYSKRPGKTVLKDI